MWKEVCNSSLQTTINRYMGIKYIPLIHKFFNLKCIFFNKVMWKNTKLWSIMRRKSYEKSSQFFTSVSDDANVG